MFKTKKSFSNCSLLFEQASEFGVLLTAGYKGNLRG